MTVPPPLLALIVGNLTDAVNLGLIDNSLGNAKAHADILESTWISSGDAVAQEKHFKSMMLSTHSQLDVFHRPWTVFSTKERRIATVMPLATFANCFEATIANLPKRKEFKELATRVSSDPAALHEAQQACLTYSASFGSLGPSRTGRRVNARDIGLHGGRLTWVAPPSPASASRTAQYWRDRLGLIDLQTIMTPTMANALVRLEFSIAASSQPIDRKNWKGFMHKYPDDLWLIRPTMVHSGNRRFVQGHPGDGPGAFARKFGKTRDLNSPTYGTGEHEMLLVCGDNASIQFRAIELLEGVPGEVAGRDNSDSTFVSNVALERNWLVA